jgi:hypothetical protein
VISTTITDEGKRLVTLSPKTPTGKPVKVQNPEWLLEDNPNSGERIDVQADALSAYIVSSDVPSTFNVRVRADADLGDGVSTIEEVIAVTVVDPQAKSLGVTVGEEEAKA